MKDCQLLCAAGTSTTVLAAKVQETADRLGLEMKVSAAAISSLEEAANDADLLLLTPQVEFKLDVVKMSCPDTKIAVLSADAFANMDAEAIIAQINRELA